MMLTRCFLLLAVASASPAVALPTLQFAQNADDTVALQVVVDGPGSLAAEVAVEFSAGPGLALTDVVVNESLFDTPNPGDSPFIAGSPVGGDTMGLDFDPANNRAFASYGAGNLGIGTFDFLTLTVEGAGELTAFGLVAQAGSLNDGLSASFTVVPEPASAMTVLLSCAALSVAGRSRWPAAV